MSELTEEPLPDDGISFLERDWPHPWMGTFLDALSKIPVVTLACEAANISRPRVYQCRELYPEFDAAWDDASNNQAPDRIEGAAIHWGIHGVPIKTTRTKTTTAANGEVTVEVTVEETIAMSPAMMKLVVNKYVPGFDDKVKHQHVSLVSGSVEHQHRFGVERTPTAQRVIELTKLALEHGMPELPPSDGDLDT